MKIRTLSICLILVFPIIFLTGLITGGDDLIAYGHQNIYEVTAVNNNSKITTTFQIYAENDRDASENVSGNGWKVISVKQLSIDIRPLVSVDTSIQSTSHADIETPLSKTSLYKIEDITESEKSGTAKINDLGSSGGAPFADEEIIDSLIGKELKNTAPVYVPSSMADRAEISQIPVDSTSTGDKISFSSQASQERTLTEDMLKNTDFSRYLNLSDVDEIKYITTVNFSLGSFRAEISPENASILKGMPKDSLYFVLGHTDNIKVNPANSIYRDNTDLSERRASDVKNYLTTIGMNPANVYKAGLGYLFPLISNVDSPLGTAANRRVEIYEFKQKK